MEIERINEHNRTRINEFIIERWFTLEMVLHGQTANLGIADGFCVMESGSPVGLITFRAQNGVMEILSLDSIRQGRGIGSALLDRTVNQAREMKCSRVTLITTNDNTDALRFYQKHGFDIIRIYRDALETARRIKPEIPLLGNDGIPLRHEIELEMQL